MKNSTEFPRLDRGIHRCSKILGSRGQAAGIRYQGFFMHRPWYKLILRLTFLKYAQLHRGNQ
jgi:hypothetical protein